MADHPRNAVRAPRPDVRAWTASGGWLDAESARASIEAGASALIVNADGLVHSIDEDKPAPLLAVLRIDAELVQLVDRVADLGDTVAGLDAGVAGDLARLARRISALER